MKRSDDPRHIHRMHLVKQLFAYSFSKEQEFSEELGSIVADLDRIDQHIHTCAPDWPIAQINRVDLGILRLAIFELLHGKAPIKVAIDEAVELAKEFGSQSSPKFVNGVLGSVVTKLEPKAAGPKTT